MIKQANSFNANIALESKPSDWTPGNRISQHNPFRTRLRNETHPTPRKQYDSPKQQPNSSESRKETKIRVYHFFPDVFFSVTFAVVHHGSTWLTKTTYSRHQNVRKATHYDHETLAFPIRMINQNHTPRRRLIFQHQRKILLNHVASIGSRYSHTTKAAYDEYRVDCRDKDP